MQHEPTKQQRAAWAQEALAVFTTRTFSGDHPDTMHRDDLQDAIADLIADLLHYARAAGFEPHQIADRGRANFIMEEAGL